MNTRNSLLNVEHIVINCADFDITCISKCCKP